MIPDLTDPNTWAAEECRTLCADADRDARRTRNR